MEVLKECFHDDNQANQAPYNALKSINYSSLYVKKRSQNIVINALDFKGAKQGPLV